MDGGLHETNRVATGLHAFLRGLASAAGVLIAACLLIAAPAHAQDGSVSASTQVNIVSPLTLTKTKDLDFGKIVPSNLPGSVVMTPTILPVCLPVGTIVHLDRCQPAEFVGYGGLGQAVKVKLPAGSTITVTNAGGQTMTINQIALNANPGLAYISGNVSANGFVRYRITALDGLFAFRVGGRLNVGANQMPGRYSGTFEVSLDYQ
jgi:spore coat protein U-like protein